MSVWDVVWVKVAGQTTPRDQTAQARALLDAGAISQPEYEAPPTAPVENRSGASPTT